MDQLGTTSEVHRNRRFAVGFLAALLILGISWLVRPRPDSGPQEVTEAAVPSASVPATGPASQDTRLSVLTRVNGAITPRAVTASPSGLVVAANMMYGHNLTLYAPDGSAQGAIDDSVDLGRFGVTGHAGPSKGAPVDAAFTPDGQTAYVTNYSMAGKGFGPEPKDSCPSADGIEPSYVYRIDVGARTINHAVKVGAVPKSVAVSPDGRNALVANWCSGDVSVIDTARGAVAATVPVGKYPLGIAVSPDSRTAYVGVMGANKVVGIDLAQAAAGSAKAQDVAPTEAGPRALALSPDGRHLYVANNDAGTVTKLDTTTRGVVAKQTVAKEPRSLAVSPDGTAVYVVGYGSATLTKLRTSDLARIDEVKVDDKAAGVAYEPTAKRVWVACYSGSIVVLDDSQTQPAPPPASSGGPSGTSGSAGRSGSGTPTSGPTTPTVSPSSGSVPGAVPTGSAPAGVTPSTAAAAPGVAALPGAALPHAAGPGAAQAGTTVPTAPSTTP